MKNIGNKIFLLATLCFGVIGCNKNVSSSNTSSSKVSTVAPFTHQIEANLKEGSDYIDHAKEYDGDFYYDEAMWYINELDKVPLPDPHVYEEDGTYYIVGTNDAGNCKYVDCYYTTDFINYEVARKIFDPSKYNGWEHKSNPAIYAPEIFKIDDYYYMYYSAEEAIGDNVRRNSVVRSESVLGPYEPIVNDEVDGLNNPLFNHDIERGLDATIFIDDDGSMYMYYATRTTVQHIVGVKLISPYQADWSTRQVIVYPGAIDNNSTEKVLLWETYRSKNIAEAPYMIKNNGKYYMTYSVNGCWNKYYNLCYAVGDSPLGTFTKPYTEGQQWTNLLMGYPGSKSEDDPLFNEWAGFASGTGHHCFFNIGDQVMVGYHAHQNRNYHSNSGFVPRYFAMDPLYFNDEGVPYCNGPTYSLQPLPEAMSRYRNIALDAKVRTQNVENEKAINDNYVVDCYNLTQEEGKEVSLGKDYSYIELTFDKEYEIGGIAVYNSSHYEKAIYDIKYIDFGNGNAVEYVEFSDAYMNYDYEFVFPNSAITVDFDKEFKSNKVTLCFDLYDSANINEIVVLGK